MFGFIIFVLGLTLGSFLNVVIFRLYGQDSIFISRSRCLNCGKILSWYELIPLISFIIQKRRCRSCGFQISFQYPAVEFLTGAGLLYLYYYPVGLIRLGGLGINPFFDFILDIVVFSFLIIIFFYDVRHQIIPDIIVFPLIFLGMVTQAAVYFSGTIIRENLVISFFAAGFFLLLWLFSRGKWLGLGDAKLILAVSLLVGFPGNVSSFLFSFWLGALFSLALILTGKGKLSSRLPFGPFIILGFLISLFYQISF